MTRDILRSTLPPPKSKYRNIKTKVEGVTFDSKGELKRWVQLCLMQENGLISDLKRQVRYELCPPIKLAGEKRASAVKYVVDFQYVTDKGELRLEDLKGFDTPVSRLKRRLVKHLHGLDVHVVRAR